MTPPHTPLAATPRDPAPGMGPLGTEARAQCTARSKRSGERCKAYPMHGTTVCKAHGGAAGQVRAAAQRRLAAEKVESDVRDALAFESLQGVTDPLGTLARLADEALAMKEALAGRVNSLRTVRYSAHGSGTEQLRAEVALYERALDRSAKFLDLLVRSGFEERRVALQERQGQLVADAVRIILAGMLEAVRRSLAGGPVSVDVLERVEADWRMAVGEVVPGALRSLTEGRDR